MRANRKAKSGRIGRALLDLVIGDFDDDLGPHAHRVPVVGDREGAQPLGHLRELPVGQALEGLAHVGEAVALPHGQVIVRQPAAAAPGSPVGGDDHAVHALRFLDLEPALAAAAGLVRAAQVLRDHALVAIRHRASVKGVRGVRGVHDEPLGQVAAAGDLGQRTPARLIRLIDEGAAAGDQTVEEEEPERHLARRAPRRRAPAGSAASAPGTAADVRRDRGRRPRRPG